MGRKQERMGYLLKSSELTVDPLPGTPLVEISGDHRVLVEAHRGVLAYSQEKITVCVKWGTISICGTKLEVMKMTRDQLIIHGCIQEVSIERRA